MGLSWNTILFIYLCFHQVNYGLGQGLLGGLLNNNNNNPQTPQPQPQPVPPPNNEGLNLDLLGLNLNLGPSQPNKGQEVGVQEEEPAVEWEDGIPPEDTDADEAPEERGPMIDPGPSVIACGDGIGTQCSPNKIHDLGLGWRQDGSFNESGVIISDSTGDTKYYYVGHNKPNMKYGKCRTPSNQNGFCRHLEHCVQPSFRNDFNTFLQHVCVIEDEYVGVCCPQGRGQGGNPNRRPGGGGGGNGNKNKNKNKNPGHGQGQGQGHGQGHGQGQGQGHGNNKNRPRPDESPDYIFEPLPSAHVDRRSCGLSEKQVSRIVGGRRADPKAWTWMAALLRSDSTTDDIRAGQYCGGVLISEYHVLTAAHCVDGFVPNEVRVRLGEYNFNETSDTRRDFEVIEIRPHNQYNRYNYENDIAILILGTSAFSVPEVKAICLPNTLDDYANKVGIVTGWGTIYYGGPNSNYLMEVLVPVWRQEDCKASYTERSIEDTHLCAGVRAGGRDACQGDSGGPLQYDVNGRWTVIGIVSWGIRCSEPNFPGVYTRVTKYLDWISANMFGARSG